MTKHTVISPPDLSVPMEDYETALQAFGDAACDRDGLRALADRLADAPGAPADLVARYRRLTAAIDARKGGAV